MKRLIITLVASISFFGFAIPASAAITFQSSLDQQSGTTVAFTTSSNANRYLEVSVMMRSGSSISITYAGVSMTEISHRAGDGSGTDVEYLFKLIAPATGSNNIVITHDGSLVRWTAAEYDGVDQTTGCQNTVTNATASAGIAFTSGNVTPTANGWIVGGMWAAGGDFTVNGNTTLRTTLNSSAIIDSNSAQSSPYAIGVSSTGSAGAEIVACELIPAAAAPPSTFATSIIGLVRAFWMY